MAIDWEAYRKKAKKRDEYEYQKNIMNNDIAPVRTTTTLSGDDIAPVTTTKKSLFDDGYDFGDITKTILNSRKTNAQETNNIGPVTSQEDKYSKLTLKEIDDEISRLQGEKKAYAEKYGNKVTLMASSAAEKILGGLTNALGIGNDVDLSDLKTGVDKLNDYQAEIETLQTYQLKKAIEEKYKVLDEETLSEVEALSGFIGEGQIKGIFDLVGIESGGETEEEKSARKSLKKKGYSDDEIAELVELHNRQKQSGINREYEKVMEDFGSKHPVAQIGQSAFTDIFGSFGGTLSEAQQYIKKLQGEGSKYGINTDDIYHGITRGNIAADTKAKADHNWKIETPTGQELDAFDIAFDIGSGVADNVARMVVGGGNSSISGAMMGSQVFNQSVIEGKEKGYSDEKALTIGLLQASIESLTEKYSVETILGDSGGIARKLAKSFVAEGSEGVTSDWLNRILDVIANGNHSETMKSYNSYIEDGYSENDALVQMIYEIGGESLKTFLLEGTTGFILGGGVSLVNIAQQKTSTQSEKNTVNKLTENERKVVEVEYENRIAESETAGSKLTKKQKKEIKENVLKDLDKGYISIDTIESALGGETYNNYTTVTKQEDAIINEYNELGNKPNLSEFEKRRFAELEKQVEEIKNNSQKDTIKSKLGEEVRNLVKDSRLAESYNEKARRGQSFEADLSKYDTKQQDVIKKAVESGVLNNTNRTHEFVDMIAKISADKGVSFDFTNNEKLKTSGFAVDGKTVNGFVDGEGNITLNANSSKWINSVVGHEITHILEGTELYTALQNTITEYAKTKGEYQSRYDALAELYEGVEGANIDNELTADLVGDYLFSDVDFINSLSTEQPGLFKKIYNEIKYLCKIATAGSKEARELEKVKRAFDKAYKESGTAQKNTTDKGDVKYSISESVFDTEGNQYNNVVKVNTDIFKGYKPRNWKTPLKEFVNNNLIGKKITIFNEEGKSKTIEFAKPNDRIVSETGNKRKVIDKLKQKNDRNSQIAVANIENLVEVSFEDNSVPHSEENRHQWLDAKGWDYRFAYIEMPNGKLYSVQLNIANAADGRYILYDINKISELGIDSMLVDEKSTASQNSKFAENSLPQNSEKSSEKKQYSLSDSDNSSKDVFGFVEKPVR